MFQTQTKLLMSFTTKDQWLIENSISISFQCQLTSAFRFQDLVCYLVKWAMWSLFVLYSSVQLNEMTMEMKWA